MNEKPGLSGGEYNRKGFTLKAGFDGKMEIVVKKAPQCGIEYLLNEL
ncbi:MAG TPA: hypothetical protein PKB02_04510 [Anaerohalosphaeraceae bacterium]|nr:hypothetical protein [Anaerohalosphaeraceae bacterium]